jgi:hypothetical protein
MEWEAQNCGLGLKTACKSVKNYDFNSSSIKKSIVVEQKIIFFDYFFAS